MEHWRIKDICFSRKSLLHLPWMKCLRAHDHYCDVIMGTMASQITSLTIVYSTVYSDADQWKNQSSASLTFVLGIHRGPVNSHHKWPVTRKMFPFDDVFHDCQRSWCTNSELDPCLTAAFSAQSIPAVCQYRPDLISCTKHRLAARR